MNNPLQGRPHRPMARWNHERQLQKIFNRFPWLDRTGFEPAPGHLALIWAFLLDVERLCDGVHLASSVMRRDRENDGC